MAFLGSVLDWYERTKLYKDFMAYTPYPLCDVYMGALIMAIAIVLIILYIWETARTIIVRQRVKRKQEEARLRRTNELSEMQEEREFVKSMLKNQGGNNSADNAEENYAVYHDAGTDAWNKYAFDKHLEKIPASSFSCVYVDVNNLKQTNDQMGHKYGDVLLKAVVDELKEQFPDSVYRLGGDEFIVMQDGTGEKVYQRKVDKIRQSLKARTEADPDGVIYSASFGIACGDGSISKQDLIDLAERNMVADKAKYKKELRAKMGKTDDYADDRINAGIVLPNRMKPNDEELDYTNNYSTPTPKEPVADTTPVDYADDGKVQDVYVNMRDHDALTKCWNKKAFQEELQFTRESDLTIIYADIDGLKVINDKLGHEAGNILISTVANILNTHFENCVYRLADDDFAIIIHGLTEAEAHRKVDLCKVDMIRKTNADKNGIFYSVSFGIAVQDGESLYEELAERSEIRLKVDKTAFRSGERKGVILEDPSLMPKMDEPVVAEKESAYDRDAIFKARRERYSPEAPAPEFDDNNALSSVLKSIKEQELQREQEIIEAEERKKRTSENLASLEANIKLKYEKDTAGSSADIRNRQRREEERAKSQELERLRREEEKGHKGLFNHKKSTDTGSSSGSVRGNTTTDDIKI